VTSFNTSEPTNFYTLFDVAAHNVFAPYPRV
jgi:hypothetical protein